MVKSAIARGLGTVVLTDHLDLDPSDPGFGRYDYDAFRAEVLRLRKSFPQICVLFGVEVDYSPCWRESALQWLAAHRWDVVIGAVHSIDGSPLHKPETFAGISPGEAVKSYFRGLAAMLDERAFDIVAHVDIIKRYMVRFGLGWPHGRLMEEAAPIIEKIAASGRWLEVNTSGLRQEVGECFPERTLLEAYRRAGGRRLVMGSDAHTAGSVAAGFDRAADMVSRAGFDADSLASSLILPLPA